MSEQKKYEKIEDAILELLDGEPQENALEFAAYLNKIKWYPICLPGEKCLIMGTTLAG